MPIEIALGAIAIVVISAVISTVIVKYLENRDKS